MQRPIVAIEHPGEPLSARILAVADSFDAMTIARAYRSAMSIDDALAELQRCAGSQFDPMIVEQLVACIRGSDTEKAPVEAARPRPRLNVVKTRAVPVAGPATAWHLKNTRALA